MSSRFVYLNESRRPLGYEPIFRSFEPSFYTPRLGLGGYIGERHQVVIAEAQDIYGKLSRADHFKLYEAAYFARGPILEIGRLHGKSTAVIAMGLRDGAQGIGAPFYSVELQDKYLPIAQEHLRERGLLELVTLLQGDSALAVAELPGSFDTIFVDGDHSYEGVMRDLHALQGRIAPGGVAMFHDCFHPANETGEYGVARALAERAGPLGLAFRGRFGGIALYEHVGGALAPRG